MKTIEVFNISGELNEASIELLKQKQYQIDLIDFTKSDNIDDHEITDVDGIIIYDEKQDNIGQICNLILKIREVKNLFIWVVSNDIPEANRVLYLKLGVTGNIHGFCKPTEFQMIIHNTFRHEQIDKSISDMSNKFELSYRNQSILLDGTIEIELTKIEFKLIGTLYSQVGKVFSYEELCQKIWNSNPKNGKIRISNIVFHLRQKMEKEFTSKKFIKTVRSKGYMLVFPS